jgi:cholesterol oxidase
VSAPADGFDVDWLVVGSGFGGSVAALRLAQKGHSVAVVECGRRFTDAELPRTTWDAKGWVWSPRFGLRGLLRTTIFKDVAIVSGAGVGGGSLVYACTLYRPDARFYANPQWAGLAEDWEAELAPHFDRAERMLGVTEYDEDDDAALLLRQLGARLGVEDTYRRTPVGIFLGTPGETVPDPYFGGEGPDRTGCVKCAECHLGCRHGAKNTLEKNYLWFAERLGVRILPERMAVDVRALGAGDGRDGYAVTLERPGAWLRTGRTVIRARGVALAAGALGTNELLARSRDRGSLPRLSPRLGDTVRTNSEALYALTLPRDHPADITRRAVITASIHPDRDTHIEFDTFGAAGDSTAFMYGPLVAARTRVPRPVELVARLVRNPVRAARTTWPIGWSRRTLIVLVMQNLDNAIALRLKRLPGGVKVMQTEQDPAKPIPKHIPAADHAVREAERMTGGIAQSSLADGLLDRPATAHILGGAVIGASPAEGVVDDRQRVFGYERLLVCDGAAVPANPGVNPSLTITALAERALSFVPSAPANLPAPTDQERALDADQGGRARAVRRAAQRHRRRPRGAALR